VTQTVVLIFAGFALLLVALGLLMSRPARVRVTVAQGTVLVKPLGLDVFWCVRRRLSVPVGSIESVRVSARADVPRPGLRLMGSALPGVIMAGTFGIGANRTFWDVRRGDPVLLIECRPGSPYRAIVLELPDPNAVMSQVSQALVAR
jgi:hypothetical protein